jgi:hypothetical protein
MRASGVSCNGCPFSNGGCTAPTVPPSKLKVVTKSGYKILATPPCNIDCLNGGMCEVAANGTSYCQCLNIWTGSNCESKEKIFSLNF